MKDYGERAEEMPKNPYNGSKTIKNFIFLACLLSAACMAEQKLLVAFKTLLCTGSIGNINGYELLFC